MQAITLLGRGSHPPSHLLSVQNQAWLRDYWFNYRPKADRTSCWCFWILRDLRNGLLRSVILPKCSGRTIEHVLESHRVRPGAWCYPRHHPTPHTPPSSWRPCGTCSGHTAGCSWAGRRLRQRWNVATWILLIRNLITNYEKKNFRFYSIFHTLFAYASFLFPLNHFSC